MAKVDFDLNLQGGEAGDGFQRYAPGDLLKGSLTVYPDGDVNCKHLYLRLQWHTAGRGTPYSQNVAEQDLFQGTLSGGMPRSFDFEFMVPYQPWSYEGHYVSTVWKVQAQIDVAWATDPKTEVGFVLRP